MEPHDIMPDRPYLPGQRPYQDEPMFPDVPRRTLTTEVADVLHSVLEHVDVEDAVAQALDTAGYAIVPVTPTGDHPTSVTPLQVALSVDPVLAAIVRVHCESLARYASHTFNSDGPWTLDVDGSLIETNQEPVFVGFLKLRDKLDELAGDDDLPARRRAECKSAVTAADRILMGLP